MKTYQIIITALLLFFPLAEAYPSDKIEYHYNELIENNIENIDFILEKANRNYLLTYKNRDEVSICIDDDSFSTVEWSLTKPSIKSDVRVKKEGEYLLINGLFKGKAINDKIHIDKDPWYQSTSFSLMNFATSGCEEKIFWVLKSDSLSTIKFRAVKEGSETVQIGNTRYDAVRIAIRPTGIKSFLWKGVYWFSLEKGVLLKFQGPKGLPGSAMSEVVFVSAEDIK